MTNQETKPAMVGAQEPVHWRAVLDPEQAPQQLKTTMHVVGFREKKVAEGFAAEQIDFYGWRYTIEPLYAAPVAQHSPEEPIELLWQVRSALALACAICDAVPNREPGHLGKLVNAQDDGTHGYRQIHDAEAALSAYLTTPTAAPVAQQRKTVTNDEQASAYMDARLWEFIDMAGMWPRAKPDPRIWAHVMVYAPVAQQPQAADLIPEDALFVCGQMGANVTRVYAAAPQQAEAVPPGYVLVPQAAIKDMLVAADLLSARWKARNAEVGRRLAEHARAAIDAAIAQQKGQP